MVQFVAMAKVLVLFIYLHMELVCEASCRLRYFCTMIKAEYALLFGLELCLAIGAIHIEASGDSLLVVQQISKGYQCFDGSLIVYLLVCLDARFTLGYFEIVHISRHDNSKELAQQASGYYVNHGVLHFYQ